MPAKTTDTKRQRTTKNDTDVKRQKMSKTDTDNKHQKIPKTEGEISTPIKMIPLDPIRIDIPPPPDNTPEQPPHLITELGDGIRLTVVKYQNEVRVDLRKWGTNAVGVPHPTKKGVSFSLQRWVRMGHMQDRIATIMTSIENKEEASERIFIGGRLQVEMKSPYHCVDLREWYVDEQDGAFKPTRKGISLKFRQWRKLCTYAGQIQQLVPEIQHLLPCYMDTDHQNQLGMLACSECNPYTSALWSI